MQNGKDHYSSALDSSSPVEVRLAQAAPSLQINDHAVGAYGRTVEREQDTGMRRWRSMLSLLKRRRKAVALIFTSVLGLAAVYMALAPRVYRSQADVLINSDKSSFGQLSDKFSAISGMLDTGARSQETEVQILQSDSVRDLALQMMAPADRAVARKKQMVVNIRPVRQTDIISVYVSGRNPAQVRRYAATICEAYLKQNQDSNSAQYRGSATFVGQELKKVSDRLDKARRAVRDYKQKNGITDLPTEGEAKVKLISDMTVQLQTLSAEAEAAKARLRDFQGQLAGVPTTQIAERTVTERPIVTQLKTQLTQLEGQRITARQEFTPNAPEVQELNGQITALQQRLRGEAEREVTGERQQPNPLRLQLLKGISESQAEAWSKQASAAALQRELGGVQGGLKQLPEREYGLSQLQQQLLTQQAIYTSLAEKYQTLLISQEAPMTNARVVSRAHEAQLVSPLLVPTLALALVLGSLCAIGGAAFIDRLQNRIYNEEEARQVSGLPILAQIPMIKNSAHPVLHIGEPMPVLLESFRMLRTQVVLSLPNAKHSVVAITSSQPHEGKSTVAVNLAIAMALNGKRVIILDADLRRPQVHSLLEVSNSTGFSSVVSGLATLDEALLDVMDNLQMLPAGPMPPNPPEMLDSAPARALIKELQERADLLIIDTPPAPFMADAQIVATMASGVIFVVSTKDARRQAVERGLELLEATGTRLLGLVLNKQDPQDSVYYSDYRYKAYLAGPSS